MKNKPSDDPLFVRGHHYVYKGIKPSPFGEQFMHMWECSNCGHQTYRDTLANAPHPGESGDICHHPHHQTTYCQ